MSVITELIDNSGLVEWAAHKAVLAGLETVGAVAETYAKKECPVDTGRLRNSIAHEVDREEMSAIIGSNVEYASWVEFGTRKQKAQPYLTPAAYNHGAEYKSIIEDSLKNA